MNFSANFEGLLIPKAFFAASKAERAAFTAFDTRPPTAPLIPFPIPLIKLEPIEDQLKEVKADFMELTRV